MTDTLTSSQRSERMSRIRGRDTTPELVLRRALHAQGFRYRLHDRSLPGTPDLVFGVAKIAVFVNGCFWHAHQCSIGHSPKTHTEFWEGKFRVNRKRDAQNIRALRQLGWRVINVWECGFSNRTTTEQSVARVVTLIRKYRSR
jgi:DNA mismatch endonuclease (patch repair protein)